MPAVIETVARRELVAHESVRWVSIDCQPVHDTGHAHSTGNELLSFTRLSNRVH